MLSRVGSSGMKVVRIDVVEVGSSKAQRSWRGSGSVSAPHVRRILHKLPRPVRSATGFGKSRLLLRRALTINNETTYVRHRLFLFFATATPPSPVSYLRTDNITPSDCCALRPTCAPAASPHILLPSCDTASPSSAQNATFPRSRYSSHEEHFRPTRPRAMAGIVLNRHRASTSI